jgi:hypothetical protein
MSTDNRRNRNYAFSFGSINPASQHWLLKLPKDSMQHVINGYH